MDRRAALKTATAATIAVIAPRFVAPSVAAEVAGDTDIARLYQEWRTARDAYEVARDRFTDADDAQAMAPQGANAQDMAAKVAAADVEANAAWSRVAPLIERMCAATPSTAAGALAILEMLAVEFDGFEVPNLGRVVANLRPALSAA